MDLIATVASLWPSGGALSGKYTTAVRDAVAETLAEAGDYLSSVFLESLPRPPAANSSSFPKESLRGWGEELRLPPIAATPAYPNAEGLHRVRPSIIPWRNNWGGPSSEGIDAGPARMVAWLQEMLGTTENIIIRGSHASDFATHFGDGTSGPAADCYLLNNSVQILSPAYQCLAGKNLAQAGSTRALCGAYTFFLVGAESVLWQSFIDPADPTKLHGVVGVRIYGTYPIANKQWLEETLLTCMPAGQHVLYRVTFA